LPIAFAASGAASAQPAPPLDWSLEAAAERARAQLKTSSGTKLVLLGTGGGPVPGRARRMTSHVIVSNGASYIIDCGLGVTNQYARLGLDFGAIRSIFITHMHPDHSVEYGPLLIIGWVHGLRPDVQVYAPPPITQMTNDFLRSQAIIIKYWSEDFHLTPLTKLDTHELSSAGD
jgi:ribonuclease BN (tRNA processing enzyme)